jgi:hypothetical protein
MLDQNFVNKQKEIIVAPGVLVAVQEQYQTPEVAWIHSGPLEQGQHPCQEM